MQLIRNYRDEFPIFDNIDGSYLDSAATSQKPKAVIDGIVEYYTKYNGNAGRGSHALALKSSHLIEETRDKLAQFISAYSQKEIVFTKNCTEALNLIVFGYFKKILKKGDNIILSIANHHANLVTWQQLIKSNGIEIRYVYDTEDGDIDLKHLNKLIDSKTKAISFSYIVNANGILNNAKKIIEKAKANNIITLLDISQSIAHMKHDMKNLGCDIAVFSGHKMFSSLGVGVLWAKLDILDKTDPFIFGGDMIEYVEKEASTFKSSPTKFEGGTLDTAAIYSLGIAIDYIQSVSYVQIKKTISDLMQYALEKLSSIDGIEIYYMKSKKLTSIISFNFKNIHSHDVSEILSAKNVMIRVGHHCTQPYMNSLNIPSSCRVSFQIYNTKDDIDRLVNALYLVKEIFS